MKRENGRRRMNDREKASGECLNGATLTLAPPELDTDLRRIIEHINLELPGEPSRTIVITGAQRGNGVSRIAGWLSASLAKAGVGDVLYLNASPASLPPAADEGDAASPGLLELVREPERCEAIYHKTAVDDGTLGSAGT
jgi:hypothetical protein